MSEFVKREEPKPPVERNAKREAVVLFLTLAAVALALYAALTALGVL